MIQLLCNAYNQNGNEVFILADLMHVLLLVVHYKSEIELKYDSKSYYIGFNDRNPIHFRFKFILNSS